MMHEKPVEPPLDAPLSWGTVGWDDDGGTYFELGNASNGGRTLVRVQLFKGRDPTEPLDQTRAQGTKLLCQIGGGFFRIPPRGTRVLVAIPDHYGILPGGSTIIGTSEPNPTIQFSATKSKIDVGKDVDLMFKARSVTIGDYENRFITVGPDNGIAVQDKDGTGILINGQAIVIVVPDGGDAKTVIQMTKTELSLVQKDGAMTKMHDGNIESNAKNNAFLMASGVFLGKLPTAATHAIYGASGPAGLASGSVYLSPT